jgi:hypothetical protein
MKRYPMPGSVMRWLGDEVLRAAGVRFELAAELVGIDAQ